MKRQCIGLLGGTFNPIHNGHLQMANEVCQQLNLDHVRLIPNRLPPHKSEVEVSGIQRLQMARIATDALPHLVVDDCELNRHQPSYTVDTLAEFRESHPNASINFIIGMDSLMSFERWHQHRRILTLANLVVCQRQGLALPTSLPQHLLDRLTEDKSQICHRANGAILVTQITPMAVSSTEVRQRLLNKEEVSDCIPAEVMDFIRSNRLYGLGEAPTGKV